MGVIYFSKGHIKEGTNSFLTALNIIEQLAKKEPDNKNWQYELSRTYEMLGDFLHSNNDPAYAELFYSVAVAIRKKVQGEEHPEYISGLCNLISLYISMHRYQVAESLA